MQDNSYEVKYDGVAYGFTSEGASGTIQKIVRLKSLCEYGFPYRYNFALGDIVNGAEDYFHRSNNRDHNELTSTIYTIAEDFLIRHPDAEISFRGDIPIKTRLYQRRIEANLDFIRQKYEVEGNYQLNGDYEILVPGREYFSFLVYRK